MASDYCLDLFEIRGRKISRNRVLYSACRIAELQSPLTVIGVGEQPVEHTGYISVSASDPVNHFDVPVRPLTCQLIRTCIVDDGTEGMDLRAVNDPLGGGDD